MLRAAPGRCCAEPGVFADQAMLRAVVRMLGTSMRWLGPTLTSWVLLAHLVGCPLASRHLRSPNLTFAAQDRLDVDLVLRCQATMIGKSCFRRGSCIAARSAA